MSALARFFISLGKSVYGYDRIKTPLTDKLISEGARINFSENVKSIPEDTDLVIYTPAIQKTNLIFRYFREKGYKTFKRSEILGLITKGHFTIAVAGTHGKTTITSIITHILKQKNYKIAAFIGGISKNYSTNFISVENPEIFIVEADEYDRSFLSLAADIAIISAIDADHLDIYHSKENLDESFRLFVSNIKSGGSLILNSKIDLFEESEVSKFYYGLNIQSSDFYASNIRTKHTSNIFDLHLGKSDLKNIRLKIPGKHNIENVVAAAAACSLLGVDGRKIKQSIETYTGVERRFDIRLNTDKIVYIDDYAHHPEEIKAVINSVRELFPGKKICGIFQPHLYSRTRDFADDFAQSLSLLDEVLLLDIYPAREAPIKGIDSGIILNKIMIKDKLLLSKKELIKKISDLDTNILLSMGAGDIDQLTDTIEKTLVKRK